jgi:hypothetical protein
VSIAAGRRRRSSSAPVKWRRHGGVRARTKRLPDAARGVRRGSRDLGHDLPLSSA